MSRRARRSDNARDEGWLLRIAMGFLLLIGILAIWFSRADDYRPAVVQAGSDLQLPLLELNGGELRLFTYPINSSSDAQLVVQRGPDDTLRVAFASCRRCFGSRHYEWWGQLICGHCGHSMKLPDPGEQTPEETDCIPVALPYSIEGSQVIVRGQAITDEFLRWFQPKQARK
ncbi:MAG: Fe-S-containing protein [Terriglobia bacterium]